MLGFIALLVGISASSALKIPSRDAVDANAIDAIFKIKSPAVADYSYEPVGSKTCLWSRWDAGKCTQARLDVTAADARGAGAFSTLLLVGALLVIAAFIVGRKPMRASAESTPLLATTA